MEKMPIAAQVYSVREEAGADFAGTMQQLKSLGYDGVELAGLYGRTPDEIKGWLDDKQTADKSDHNGNTLEG